LEPSWERKGLDLLLAHYPMATLARLDRHEGRMQEPGWFDYGGPAPGEPGGWAPTPPGPWVSVTLEVLGSRKQFGVWKETGAVYTVDRHGACADDPFLVPEGSSYNGPVEVPA
jgi:hypothetical protein